MNILDKLNHIRSSEVIRVHQGSEIKTAMAKIRCVKAKEIQKRRISYTEYCISHNICPQLCCLFDENDFCEQCTVYTRDVNSPFHLHPWVGWKIFTQASPLGDFRCNADFENFRWVGWGEKSSPNFHLRVSLGENWFWDFLGGVGWGENSSPKFTKRWN